MIEKCYSLDGENFALGNLGDAIDACDCEPKVGDVYFEGDGVRLDPTAGINSWTVESILENMDERVYDEIGEFYENDCSDVTDDAKTELLEVIEAWARKHIDLSRYFTIQNVRECEFTAEDLE